MTGILTPGPKVQNLDLSGKKAARRTQGQASLSSFQTNGRTNNIEIRSSMSTTQTVEWWTRPEYACYRQGKAKD